MAAWPCPVLPILFQPSSTLSCLLPLCRMAALSIPATEAVAPAGDVAEQQDGGAPSGDASGDVRQAAARVVEALDPAQPQLRRHLSVLRATLEANQVLLLSFKLPVLDRRPSCLHTAAEIWSSCPTGSVPCWPSTQDAAQAPRRQLCRHRLRMSHCRAALQVQRKPKIPKGTRDLLPDQMAIREMAFRTCASNASIPPTI